MKPGTTYKHNTEAALVLVCRIECGRVYGVLLNLLNYDKRNNWDKVDFESSYHVATGAELLGYERWEGEQTI